VSFGAAKTMQTTEAERKTAVAKIRNLVIQLPDPRCPFDFSDDLCGVSRSVSVSVYAFYLTESVR
jgi:hypothetical protein